MKTIKFIIILLLTSAASFAQVGIGNTDPKASLDITASNTATPSNTDGILIPKIDNFPATNPGTDQNGMLVFVTGNGTPTKGFYYWDNGATSWVSVIGVDTKNTLDGAYNEGGPGIGKDINAMDGAVRINGTDGILVTGTLGSGSIIDDEITGDGVRMFFNPNKAAYRGGIAESGWWNDSRIGLYSFSHGRRTWVAGEGSVAFGRETTANGAYSFAAGYDNNANGNFAFVYGFVSDASGDYAVSLGNGNNASGLHSLTIGASNAAFGDYSTAIGNGSYANGNHSKVFGLGLTAESYGETVIGLYDTNYTANSNSVYSGFDRLLVVGNGSTNTTRSNALTIYKNGLMNINDQYNMPLTDGSNGQVMTTDGVGNISFQNQTSDSDWYEEGTTTSPNDINDNIFTQGNVGVGNSTPNASLDIDYSGSQVSGMNIDYSQTSSTAGYGQYINAETTSASAIIGSAITIQNSGSSSATTGSAVINTASGDNNVAYSAQVNGSGDNNVGISTVVSGANDENIGGLFNVSSGAVINTGILATATGGSINWAGHFGVVGSNGSGNVFVNDLLEVASAFRYSDGNETLGYILSTDANGDANWVNPNTIFTNTDNQNLAVASLTGTTLNLGIQNGTGTSVNLSSLQDGTGSDNQTIDNLTLNGTTLELSLEDDAQPLQTLNLAALQDGTGTDNQNLQTPTLSGTTLNLNIESGTGTSINLAPLQDGTGTDNQNLTTPTLSGTTLNLNIQDGTGTSIDLAGLQDGNTQNTLDQAYDQGGPGAGKNIIADNGTVRINGNDGFLVTGTNGSGNTIDTEITGAGRRMFFNPRKAAFRSGMIDGAQWDDINIGYQSTAFGGNTTASGTNSTAFGSNAIASGSNTTAFGSNAIASGTNTTAFGSETTASNTRATAFGFYSDASGISSISFGSYTEASNENSTAFGVQTIASGENATAFGNNTTASGTNSTAFGISTIASGNQSTAFGNSTDATNFYATAFGFGTEASGENATAFGDRTEASGENATAFGSFTNAPSYAETAIGKNNTAYTPVNSTGFNVNDRVFSIGNGEFNTNRSNALTIYKSGLMNINDEYNMPLTDAATGQVMTTDGAGNVTFETQLTSFAAAKVLISADQNITGTGWDKLNFDTPNINLSGNFNTTTDRFVATEAGIYQVTASYHSSAASTSTSSFGIAVYVDGTINKRTQVSHYGAGLIHREVTSLVQLTAGQYIEIYAYHTGGITIESNAGRTTFEVIRMR